MLRRLAMPGAVVAIALVWTAAAQAGSGRVPAAHAGSGRLPAAQAGSGHAPAAHTALGHAPALAYYVARADHAVVASVAAATRAVEPRVAHVNALATETAGESRCQKQPPPVPEHPINHPEWLTGVTITEYYPAPERWFTGRHISAPGMPGKYAADWLYSARGLAMEGDGVDRFGRRAHIAQLGSTGWVNAAGRPTVPVCLGKWSDGPPAWLIGGWRNRRGGVTFPLASGGWANGRGVRTLPYGGVTFALGPSLPLHYYHSIAVDPRLIPLGSRVYVPAYRGLGGGWFLAQDTGGAIKGRHIDVYRPPPSTPTDLGRYMTGQRIYVLPPG